MRKLIAICLLSACLFGCKKTSCPPESCDIQRTYSENAAKVTITNGIWGTVSSMEGDCMPIVSPETCKHCPVKRTVKLYEYTTMSQAVPSGNSTVFYDSFSTALLAQTDADDDGFFQLNVPAGHYTMVIVEEGKLYANETDGQAGLFPISHAAGIEKVNLTMTYKAVF